TVGRRGFTTVLVARLIPLVPFSSANYAFGVTSVTWPAYASATAVGILPGTALYVAVGAYGAQPGSWPFILAVVGLVLLSLAGVIRSRVSRDRDPSTGDPSTGGAAPPARE
ncbi:TVP38/TMEM64 family protein, partial [Nocardioides sp.]|uniref:TVP38/TMEM64 family protein n=1 Tax=Nocardioides sp. TaxID=35761 RepID=UPI00356306DD